MYRKIFVFIFVALTLTMYSCSRHPNPVDGNSFRFSLRKMTVSNSKFEIYYDFQKEPISYTHEANIYPFGYMVVVNKDNKVLKLFGYNKFIALLGTHDEVLSCVNLRAKPYMVLDWHNPILDAFEYRLDIPASRVVRIPLNLDVRYAPEKVIRQDIGKSSEISVDIYPCDFSPGSAKLNRDRLPVKKKLGSVMMTLPIEED